MWKIQAKIIFIVPLENDKKNHRHYHHHYFLRQRNSRTIVRSPYYRAKRDGRSLLVGWREVAEVSTDWIGAIST